MIPVEQARRLLLEVARPLETIDQAVERALGLVTGDAVVADRDYPPTDRSAMDGYAVRAADVAREGAELTLSGEARAGAPVSDLTVEPGGAVRIFTGAIVPEGADAVVMAEYAEESPDHRRVAFREPTSPGRHIRRRGEDYRAGQTIMPAGSPIHAAEMGALATLGRARVRVHRRPSVAVLSSGDEIVTVDVDPGPHQLRNSNARALLGRLAEMSIDGRDLGVARDEPATLRVGLERALDDADVLIVSGGVSVGKYDLVRESLEQLGTKLLFHRVAMRPGKPVLAGMRGRCLVAGLPGNPVSATTCFDVLVAPALRRMMGYPDDAEQRVRAALDEPLRPRPGRTTFHLGRLDWRDGRYRAQAVKSASSGDGLSLVRANAYLVTPADAREMAAGEEIEVMPWHAFHLRRRPD